jgi:hypothetical protein
VRLSSSSPSVLVRRHFQRPWAPFFPPFRNAVVIFSTYLALEFIYNSTFPAAPKLKVDAEVEFPKSGGIFAPKENH